MHCGDVHISLSCLLLLDPKLGVFASCFYYLEQKGYSFQREE